MDLSKRRYIISLDQGTTSSRAVVFDNHSNIVAVSQKEFKQICFPIRCYDRSYR